ncbi:MAG TPA: DUF2341 domain-containing protein, partial [Anaerolineales bacterium]|nr:DUF2341 domain-containing protein [Anaerolineales bacterium]
MNQVLKLSSKFLKNIPMLFNRRQFKKSYRKLSHLEFDQVKLARQLGHHYKTFQRQPRSRKALFIGSLILITLTPLAIYLAKNPKEVRSWWNDNWQYRIKATITEQTGSSLTDFQVAITLDTASLITAGKLQTDCDDIRVYDSTHSTSQDYWIESCNTTATKIWLKQSFSANQAKYYYLYYGNPSAQNAETSGDNIFISFDDFEDTTLDSSKWTRINSGTASDSISNGQLTITGSGDWWDTSDTARIIVAQNSITTDYVAEARISSTASNYQRFLGLRASNSATNSRFVVLGLDENQSHISTYYRSSDGASAVYQGNDITTYTEPFNAIWKRNGSTLTGYIESTQVNQITSISDLNYPALTATAGTTVTFDHFFVRQYAATEPSSTSASEESGPGPISHWKFNEAVSASLSQPINQLEQHINIINQTYTVTGTNTGNLPADNSLGIIHWDSDKYPNATVYLEADLAVTGNGSYQGTATVSLFTTGGTSIT